LEYKIKIQRIASSGYFKTLKGPGASIKELSVIWVSKFFENHGYEAYESPLQP
jgi:hypothetical protein